MSGIFLLRGVLNPKDRKGVEKGEKGGIARKRKRKNLQLRKPYNGTAAQKGAAVTIRKRKLSLLTC